MFSCEHILILLFWIKLFVIGWKEKQTEADIFIFYYKKAFDIVFTVFLNVHCFCTFIHSCLKFKFMWYKQFSINCNLYNVLLHYTILKKGDGR